MSQHNISCLKTLQDVQEVNKMSDNAEK